MVSQWSQLTIFKAPSPVGLVLSDSLFLPCYLPSTSIYQNMKFCYGRETRWLHWSYNFTPSHESVGISGKQAMKMF